MIAKKGYINDLFFVYNTKPLRELDKHVTFEKFKEVMIEKMGFCNDDDMLDYEKLKIMYDEYVSFFMKHVGDFRNYFMSVKTVKMNTCDVKPYMVYDETLWVNQKGTTTVTYFTNRCYKKEFIGELLKTRQTTVSKESFQKRYGENWKEKFDEYVDKMISTRNSNPNIDIINYNKGKSLRYEYYLDKINGNTGELYTEEEAKEKIRECKYKGVKITAEKRRGKKGVTCRSVEYWISKGFSKDDAKEKVREIQGSNTVGRYIKKYGEQEGIRKWIERNKKWGEQMMQKKSELGHVGSAQSKSANNFFNRVVDEFIKENITFDKIYYGEKEFCKWDKENKRVYFYDFVIPSIWLCVEYNGLKFHPKEGDVNWIGLFSGITYEEKLKYDKQKIKTIEECGFTTIVIWEDDDVEMSVQKIVNVCKKLKE